MYIYNMHYNIYTIYKYRYEGDTSKQGLTQGTDPRGGAWASERGWGG